MNFWRLSLARKKCANITFSRAVSTKNDELDINIYAQKITYDNYPKFLGIVFDA